MHTTKANAVSIWLSSLYFEIILFLFLGFILSNSHILVAFSLLLTTTEFLNLLNKRLVWIALLPYTRINYNIASSTIFLLGTEKEDICLNLQIESALLIVLVIFELNFSHPHKIVS